MHKDPKVYKIYIHKCGSFSISVATPLSKNWPFHSICANKIVGQNRGLHLRCLYLHSCPKVFKWLPPEFSSAQCVADVGVVMGQRGSLVPYPLTQLLRVVLKHSQLEYLVKLGALLLPEPLQLTPSHLQAATVVLQTTKTSCNQKRSVWRDVISDRCVWSENKVYNNVFCS